MKVFLLWPGCVTFGRIMSFFKWSVHHIHRRTLWAIVLGGGGATRLGDRAVGKKVRSSPFQEGSYNATELGGEGTRLSDGAVNEVPTFPGRTR